jgi:SAM-dependent methyltransferase
MATEAEKIRPRILSLLENKSVLDIGCGSETIVPWALGVDDGSETLELPKGVIRAKISPDSISMAIALGGRMFDVVFSSHALEHMRTPILETLQWWLNFVKPGGYLLLYLPSEQHYVFDSNNPKRRNPGHHHFLTINTFTWYLDQLTGVDFSVEPDIDLTHNRYSFLCIIRKH